MPAVHRTLIHTRATHVQYYKPHAMEETYYWTIIAGKQLENLFERIIGVLNPSDKNPFNPVLFNIRAAVRDDLNMQPLNEGQLLLDDIVNRGITAHTIYGNFLKKISYLSRPYSPPLIVDSQPRNPSCPPTRSPRQQLPSIALSYTRGPPTSSTTNPTLWRKRSTGR